MSIAGTHSRANDLSTLTGRILRELELRFEDEPKHIKAKIRGRIDR